MTDLRLPDEPGHGILVVRTDYADDARWRRLLEDAAESWPDDDVERAMRWEEEAVLDPDDAIIYLKPVEAPGLSGLPLDAVCDLPRGPHLAELAVADSRSMEDDTLLFVQLRGVRARTEFRAFRADVSYTYEIVASLALCFRDFAELAGELAVDGPEPGIRDAPRPATASPGLLRRLFGRGD